MTVPESRLVLRKIPKFILMTMKFLYVIIFVIYCSALVSHGETCNTNTFGMKYFGLTFSQSCENDCTDMACESICCQGYDHAARDSCSVTLSNCYCECSNDNHTGRTIAIVIVIILVASIGGCVICCYACSKRQQPQSIIIQQPTPMVERGPIQLQQSSSFSGSPQYKQF